MMGDCIVVPALRGMHVNWIIKSGLRKGPNIINLMRGKPQDSGQYEYQTNCAPLNHRSIGVPVANAILLLRAINTNATFVLELSPFDFVCGGRTRWH